MKIHSSSAVGATLRQARLAAGIAQGHLAEMLGVSVWCLNRVEHGKRGFETEWVERMPPRLGAAVKEVLAREVDEIRRRASYGFVRGSGAGGR